MAQLAAYRSLDEVRDTRREVLITLAAVDELDIAADIFQRNAQVSAIEAVIINALDLVLVRQPRDLARNKVETNDRPLNADQVTCLEPLLKQLALCLAAPVECIKRRPVPADQALDAVLVLEGQPKRGQVYLAAEIEATNALFAGECSFINGRVSKRPLCRR